MDIQLPAEVLTEILDYSSTEDLLQHMRFVSQRWNQLATAISRQRLVSFKNARLYHRRSICNLNTFPNPDNLPWSSIDFEFDQNDNQSCTFTRTIAETFGHQIRELSVFTTPFYYEHIVLLLGRMPSLRILDIEEIKIEKNLLPMDSNFPVKEQGVIELPRLYEFRIEISVRETIQFLEFILETAPLTSLSLYLDFSPFRAGDLEAEWICSILSNLKVKDVTVQIEFPNPNNLWEVLASQQNLVIHDLSIHSTTAKVSEDDILCLERVLANCNGLRSLSLDGFVFASKRSRFEIPPLPALKDFQIFWMNNAEISLKRTGLCPLNFRPLLACNFPCLEEFIIAMDRSFHSKWVPRLYRSFGSGTFRSIKVLNITLCDTVVGPWTEGGRFPNLAKFSARITTGEDLKTIFVNLYCLEELTLTLHSVNNKDVNAELFTGFNGARNMLEKMTKLKELHVAVEDGAQLCDTGAVLFTLLPPLNLTLSRCVSLSEGCIAQLRNHHLRFELTNRRLI